MAGKQADIKVGVVTNYDDKGIKSAEKGLAGFKSSISEADGLGGKLSAGWKNASSQISANAGLMAAGAGVAIAGFAVKAVGAFTQTAKAAIDLSTSTGLAVEDASRWIAVGDDYQVGADALATGLGKIAKTLDNEKWSKYGIATRDAGGQARDTNDILLDSFDTLSKVKNETERARIGQELFGKGYQSLTPILGHTRAEYEKMLGSVEKGQVITSKEAGVAEKMRLAQDDLHDALQEVTLAVGQLVAEGAPVVSFFAKAIIKTLEWKDALQDIDDKFGGSGIFSSAPSLLGKVADAASDVKDRFQEIKKYGPFSTEEDQKQQDFADHMKNYVVPAIDDLDRANKDLAAGAVVSADAAQDQTDANDELAKAAEALRKKQEDLNSAQVDARKRQQELTQARRDAIPTEGDYLQSVRDLDTAYYNLQQQQDANTKTQDDSKVSDADKAQSTRDVETAQHDLAGKIFETAQKYADQNGAIDGSLQQQALMRDSLELSKAKYPELAGVIDDYIKKLYEIPGQIITKVSISSGGNSSDHDQIPLANTKPGQVYRAAEGAVVKATPGGSLLVAGEAGHDEAIVPLDGKHGLPGDGSGTTTNNYVTINMPVGSSGDDVVKAIRKFEARNGPGWRQ